VKSLWKVCVPADGESFESADAFDIEGSEHEDPEDIAYLAAVESYSNWAWEAEWPIVFRVRRPSGKQTYDVEVEMEPVPEFHPTMIGKPVTFEVIDEASTVSRDMIDHLVKTPNAGVVFTEIKLSPEDRAGLNAGPEGREYFRNMEIPGDKAESLVNWEGLRKFFGIPPKKEE